MYILHNVVNSLMRALVRLQVLGLLHLWVLLQADINNGNCPLSCTCVDESFSSLVIDCTGRTSIILGSHNLTSELDQLMMSVEVDRHELTSLTIVNSPLNDVPQSVCQLTKLRSLYLNSNQLMRLSVNCINKLVSLEIFSAGDNRITELQDGLFDSLMNLREIYLHRNLISSIGLRVFSNSSTLINLRSISLASNQLKSLEPWPMIRGSVPHLSTDSKVTVNLANNIISLFTNKVGWNYSCMSNTSYIRLNLQSNAMKHISDFSIGWGIHNYSSQLCLMRSNIHRWLQIGGKKFVCDCLDYDYVIFSQFFKHSDLMDKVMCADPPELVMQWLVRVPPIQLVCEETNKCPRGCKCIYRPANATYHVSCNELNSTSLLDELPPLPKTTVSYKLEFSEGCSVERIENRTYLSKVSILILSNSGVKFIDGDAWTDLFQMRYVYLDGNSITSLPERVQRLNVSGTLRLSLGRNPWSCTCANKWMIEWLKSIEGSLLNPDEILCGSPSAAVGKNIQRLSADEMCGREMPGSKAFLLWHSQSVS
jgi:Leucine-rich repeat (LRR) protein